VLACAGALRKVELPVWYAALYLLHPVAALYSRTAMSDVPTMTLTMLGLWCYLGPASRPFLAGLAWGLMPHFRFSQAMAIAALGAAALLRDLMHSHREGRLTLRRSLLIGAGLSPGLLSWFALNALVYGGPLDTPVS
jgi:4-amino-4-deoxy-L-arabinose transferase-like glycosyltransferase